MFLSHLMKWKSIFNVIRYFLPEQSGKMEFQNFLLSWIISETESAHFLIKNKPSFIFRKISINWWRDKWEINRKAWLLSELGAHNLHLCYFYAVSWNRSRSLYIAKILEKPGHHYYYNQSNFYKKLLDNNLCLGVTK